MENTIDVGALTLAEADKLMNDMLKKFSFKIYDDWGHAIGVVDSIHELSIMKKLLPVYEADHG